VIRAPLVRAARAARDLRGLARLAVAAAALPLAAGIADAQYFGRNKVQYQTFDFDVLRTPHFDVHYYPVEETAVRDAARMLERWNTRLTALMNHPLTRRKPVVLYADQPDFQQTNVVSGELDEGTGGVTESLLDRLVMPLTGSYAESDHVLGHEMVHVFQYDLAAKLREKERNASLDRMPLYLVEGMAEYLSIGPRDAHTAMWMRDAVRRNDLPTIKQLTNGGKYFPYRYGEALWAYVGGTWGDDMVPRLFEASLRTGFDGAVRRVLGMSTDSLSKRWHAATRAAYAPVIAGRQAPDSVGDRRPIGDGKRGEYAVSPAISPDGRSIAYVATRSVEGFRLVVADVETGRVRRTLATPGVRSHFDALSFLYSAGSWSPDGKRLAIVTYAKGDQEIALVDAESGRIVRRVRPKDAGSVTTVAWSPDGQRLAFSGTTGGLSDLGLFDLATGETRWLMRDRYADLQPAWSPDGASLAFVTDRPSPALVGGGGEDLDSLRHAPLRLALLDVASGVTRVLPGLRGTAHLDPQFAPDGRSLYFVSDAGGMRDVYRVPLDGSAIFRVTRLATGVSGVTATSPAIAVARGTGRLAFSVFDNGGFRLATLDAAHAQGEPMEGTPRVARAEVRAASTGGLAVVPLQPTTPGTDTLTVTDDAARLPSDAAASAGAEPRVERYLGEAAAGLPADSAIGSHDYHAGLRLAMIGNPSVGLGVGGVMGTQAGGGASAYFTDVLGDHTVGAALQLQGQLRDAGGQLLYLNTKRRWNWGASVSRVPYVYGYAGLTQTGVQYTLVHFAATGGSLITQFPFTATRRLELQAGYTRYSYGLENIQQSFSGQASRTELAAPPALGLGQGSLALVGDDASFGFTSPVAGTRYRLEVSPTVGSLAYQSLLVDVRRYFHLRPVTLAVRGLHYGRYGRDGDDYQLGSMFLGDGGLVRGYSYESFGDGDCTSAGSGALAGSNCPQFDRLLGSRMAVASAELRIPLLGTEGYGLFATPLPPVELAPFVDVGAAWTSTSAQSWRFDGASGDRTPVASAGVAARMNLFGYAVLQTYYARPFQRASRRGVFGFVLQPGW
jgi:hypothetical protein